MATSTERRGPWAGPASSPFVADLLVLLVVLACVQSAVLVGGRTLIPLSPSYSTMPRVPYGYAGPMSSRASTIDPAGSLNIAYAFDAYGVEAARAGHLPFWNPYQGLGQPFLANPLSALFYPPRALYFLIPSRWWDLVWLLNVLLGALFLSAFLRLAGAPAAAGLLAGTGVIGSGYFQQYLALREVIASAVWWPLLLYVMERARLQPEWRHRHWALALAVFCTIAGGQPEVTFVSLLAALAYALVRSRRRMVAAVRLFAPGALAGLLLAAPLLLPFVDYGWSASSGHAAGTEVGLMNAPPWTAMTYVFPYLFGGIHSASREPMMWFLAPGWMPVAVLFLALASLVGPRDQLRGVRRVLWLTTILSAAKIWGAPGMDWLGGLPLFERVIYPRYAAFLLTFGLAGLAGLGLIRVRDWTAREWRIGGGLWLALAIGILAAAFFMRAAPLPRSSFALLGGTWAVVVPAGLWWVLARRKGDIPRLALTAAAAALLQAEAYLPGYNDLTYMQIGLGCLTVYVVIVAIVSAAPVWERRVGLAIICALVAAPPLAVAGTSPRDGLPKRHDVLSRPPYLDALERLQQGGRFRSYPLDATPQPNFSAPFMLSSISNLEVLLPTGSAQFVRRYLDRGSAAAWFAGNYSGGRQPRTHALGQFRTNRRFFDLIAVRYLLTYGTAYAEYADLFPSNPAAVDPAVKSTFQLTLVHSDETPVRIWENRQAVARVFLAPEAELVASRPDALARLGQFENPTRRVAIEQGAPFTAASDASAGELVSFELEPDDVRIEYRADAPGILTMTDSFEEGWRARVNHAEVPVLRVNGTFRGVRLDRPGSYRVEFFYRPPLWRLSLALAAAGVLLLAFATAIRPRAGGSSETAA